jgi:hypothetical protein
MKTLKLLACSSLMAAMLLTPAFAEREETETKTIDADGAKTMVVDCEFGAGHLNIVPEDMAEAAKLTVTYDPRKFDYDVDYNKRGDEGRLYLESKLRRHRDLDDSRNDWDLTLSTRYPTELDLEVGAAEADIDLGGIQLTDVSLDMGAAKGTIDFSKPNPERIHEMSMEIGASSLDVLNLGNANFDYLKFSSGAAATTLDFRGDFHGDAEVSLDIGVGSADIILPKGLAVRVTGDDGFFSSIDFHGGDVERVRRGARETSNYAEAADRLTIDLDVSMGSVDIYWK